MNVDNDFVGKRVLITGGSGFIGTNLVEYCTKLGHTVLNIDQCPPRNTLHQSFWHKIDLLDKRSLQQEIQSFEPHYIYHLAARTDLDGKCLDDYKANTLGVSNLIEAISTSSSLSRIIFASSRLVCKIGYQPKDDLDYCPTTYYGESKVLGEKIVRESKIIPCPWMIVRPTSIWGEWFDIPYKTFFTAIAQGRYFHPGNLEIYKSFGYVGNTVYELEKLLFAPDQTIKGRTLYLQDYPPIHLKSMSNCIQEAMHAKTIQTLPLIPLQIISLIGDLLKIMGLRNPPLTSFRLKNLITNMVYDSTLLEKIVEDLPYTMEQGIIQTIEWMREYGEI